MAKDQDTVKSPLTITPASKRLSSVWGEKRLDGLSQRCSPDSASAGSAVATDETRSRRVDCARWIEAITGEPVPSGTDREFRAALRSGILLCKVINNVTPGAVKMPEGLDASSTKQRYDNVQSFILAASNLGVPSEHLCSITDIDYEGPEERPLVVDCLLWLKRLRDQRTSSPHRRHAAMAMAASSPAMQTVVPTLAPPPSKGSQSTAVMQRLLNHCTVKLSQSMTYHAEVSSNVLTRQADTITVDAVGPVLESVLGGLTQEYESRLLAKDREINATKDKLIEVQRQLDSMVMRMNELMNELAAQQQKAMMQVSLQESNRSKELQELATRLQSQLSEKERQCAELQSALTQHQQDLSEHTSGLQAQVEEAEARLAQIDVITNKYRAMQEENRKLYNQVQDLRGAIRVFCRIRPAGRTNDSSEVCVEGAGEDGLVVRCPGPKNEFKDFQFDKVFEQQVTQDMVYADTQPLIRSVLDGFNVCIFAYGQTGSGKTHTMSGTNIEQVEGRGINYRALDDLFRLRDDRSTEVVFTIKVQMVEIYNETLRDLLVDSPGQSAKLEIHNTQASGLNVPGAKQEGVTCSEDVLWLMEKGARNRKSAETRMNERSSRSHQVLTVIVDGDNLVTGAQTHGCLHLVDLAGSERTNKSEATGDRLVEANHINSSLSALGDVMAALASKAKHVPFRNSKLTQLLADSLSGQAKVMMFMHIAPEGNSYQETLSTLKFATRVSEITLGQAKRNVEAKVIVSSHKEVEQLRSKAMNQESHIITLQRQVSELQADKARCQDEAKRLMLQVQGRQPADQVACSPAQQVDNPSQAHTPTWASPAMAFSRLPLSPRLTPTALRPGSAAEGLTFDSRTPGSATARAGMYLPLGSSRPATTPILTARTAGRYGTPQPGPATALPSPSTSATPQLGTGPASQRVTPIRLPHDGSLTSRGGLRTPTPSSSTHARPGSAASSSSFTAAGPLAAGARPLSSVVGGKSGALTDRSHSTGAALTRIPSAPSRAAIPAITPEAQPTPASARARSGVFSRSSAGDKSARFR
ncbi:P-loop containing nucleoside triphosphate hydrolase protein [Haematococcus lacustris]